MSLWVKLLIVPFKLVAALYAYSPRVFQMFAGWCLGFFWCDITRIRRKVVLDNIGKAFPEWSKKRRSQVARQSFYHLGLTITEFNLFPFLCSENIGKYVSIHGLEHIEEAKKKGKGVLLMGSHMANGDMGLVSLAYNNHPVHLISKKFKTKWLNDLWFGLRSRHGTKFIEPHGSSFDILRALRKNEPVVFVVDQFMGPPYGVEVEFFKIKTGAASGLALFAERSQAPVLPIFTYRKGKHTVVRILPEIPLEVKVNREETIKYMTQKYTDKIEEIVREFPEQWMWVHRRWKKYQVI